MEDLCEVCGNVTESHSLTCPFCGTKRQGGISKTKTCFHRTVNLEAGLPPVDQALERLARELERARNDGVVVLTIIHGYGASGRGGVIRKECRKMLEFYKERHVIRNYIIGELFSRKAGATKTLLRRLPQLLQNDNLNKGNKGISIVEM